MTLLSLSLAQVFGENATQDNSYLVIKKADLPLLTVSSNNRAEQLFVAICVKALEIFIGQITDENNDIITDENNDPLIEYDESELYELLKAFPWSAYFLQKRQYFVERKQIIIQSFEVE